MLGSRQKAPKEERGSPGWMHDVWAGLESVRCLVTGGGGGCSQVSRFAHSRVSGNDTVASSCLGTLGESRRACSPQRPGEGQRRPEGRASGKEAGAGRPSQGQGFQVGLALSLRGHTFFSPQLWFVYFDLENCAQFLSEHVREMKTSQEVRYLTCKTK